MAHPWMCKRSVLILFTRLKCWIELKWRHVNHFAFNISDKNNIVDWMTWFPIEIWSYPPIFHIGNVSYGPIPVPLNVKLISLVSIMLNYRKFVTPFLLLLSMTSEECDLFLGRVVPNCELLKQIDAISQSTSRRITRGCKGVLCRLIPVPTIYWVGVYSTTDSSSGCW